MIGISGLNRSASRYSDFHFLRHYTSAYDDYHHLVFRDVESFLNREQLIAQESARQGNRAQTHIMQGIDKVLCIESSIDITLEGFMSEEAFHISRYHDTAMYVLSKPITTALHAKEFVSIVSEEDVGVPGLTVTSRRRSCRKT